MILAICIYKSPWWFLPSFKSIGLSVQEKKRKIDFQDGRHSSHLGFPIKTILSILDLKVTPCFLPSFKSISLSVQEKKWKIDFQDGRHGGHLGFPIETISAIFYLKDTPMPPVKFRVSWLYGSGEEAKNRCWRSRPWRPSRISNLNDFSYFWSKSHVHNSYQVLSIGPGM